MADNVKAVPVETWRDAMLSRGVIDRTAANPWSAFNQIKNSLQARSLVGERDGMVWSAE